MTLFEVLAVIITLTALIGYANERSLRLPPSIGVLVGGLLLSLALFALDAMGLTGDRFADRLLAQIDFGTLLMQGMLSFLLFAGALHVDVNDLLEYKWTILLLATAGTLISTALVGGAAFALLRALGFDVPPAYAFLFGALISPTDPIAVLSILRRAGAPRSLEVIISGESLFNDGVGVVVFTVIAGLALGGGHPDASFAHAAALFAREAVGGAVYGAVLGAAAFQLLRRVDNYSVEIMLTLAVAAGGYALAGELHTSGPIAVVVAGIMVGNQGRRFAMSQRTREHLDTFWLVVDDTLNAVLFVLIGLELLVVEITARSLAAAVLIIPVTLLARWVSVGIPIGILRMRAEFVPYTIRMMTWGGLRGGIAVALALSLPASPAHDVLLVMTYGVVVFSILVQGLTVAPLARAAARGRPQLATHAGPPDVFESTEPGRAGPSGSADEGR